MPEKVMLPEREPFWDTLATLVSRASHIHLPASSVQNREFLRPSFAAESNNSDKRRVWAPLYCLGSQILQRWRSTSRFLNYTALQAIPWQLHRNHQRSDLVVLLNAHMALFLDLHENDVSCWLPMPSCRERNIRNIVKRHKRFPKSQGYSIITTAVEHD